MYGLFRSDPTPLIKTMDGLPDTFARVSMTIFGWNELQEIWTHDGCDEDPGEEKTLKDNLRNLTIFDFFGYGAFVSHRRYFGNHEEEYTLF